MDSSCRGCGAVLDPTEEQVNATVNQVLTESLSDAQQHGGVCPLCGHSKAVPYSHRKTVQFVLLSVAALVGISFWIHAKLAEHTLRSSAVADAISRMNDSVDLTGMLGKPITLRPGMEGEVKEDETGWQEMRLTLPVHGPHGDAMARVAGGRMTGPWAFTTFEVIVQQQHKKVDLISGRIVVYEANAYTDVHTLPAKPPEFFNLPTPVARLDGEWPCVSGTGSDSGFTPQFGSCAMPVMQSGPVDRVEADLRYARFVLRETDLYLNDEFQVPLTRTYDSDDWISQNHVHAFGLNSNHPYDIAPLGSRNPYTYQMIVLEDGDFLYFNRISKGSGYEDAVYQHSETSTRFYKALERWNGHGWTTRLEDGSEIDFPESYNAKNLAQGAPTEMRNSRGERLQLIRDGQRNLQEIRTPHGHWIKFIYDGMARVIRAEDDAGNWVRYEYNTNGLLVSVVLSSGRERHYEYEGVKMTAISDGKGKFLLHNGYRDGRLESQDFGGGSVYAYRYDLASNGAYVEKARVTTPDQVLHDVQSGSFVPDYLRNVGR